MLSLSQVINSEYLSKEKITSIRKELNSDKSVQCVALDDFLRDDVFSQLETLFKKQKYRIVDHRKDDHCSNKTIFVEDDFFTQVFEFFQSPWFVKYLQLFYMSGFERHSVITREEFQEMGFPDLGAIAQLYETGDYTQWHTDIAKDLSREQDVQEWWMQKWHEHVIENFEEVGAFVYYLYNSDNTGWNKHFGGNFETGVFNESTQGMDLETLILPKNNRFLLIKSSNVSYHRVSPILQKGAFRISFQDLLINYHKG